MKFTKTIVLMSMLAFSGAAFAQTPAAPAAPAAPSAAAPMSAKMPKDKSMMKAKAKECSTQADAKGLHGKERKKFREACKKG